MIIFNLDGFQPPLEEKRMARFRPVLAAIAAFTFLAPQQASASNAHHGEIIWDKYGVPHIYGATIEDALYGYGYAQMKSHAETILRKVAMARGRLAELFGPGPHDVHINSDIRARSYGITKRAKDWLATGTKEQRRYLQAFCAGGDAYVSAHGDTIAPRLKKLLPVGPEDVLAVTQYSIHFNMMLEQWNVWNLIRAWRRGKSLSSIEVSRRSMRGGSNGWALAPARTVNGRTILMGNPHLPWGVSQPLPDLDIYHWTEAHLVVGDPLRPTLNAYGASFTGAPYIGVGFTDDIGWTHTNNTIKNIDLYELKVTADGEYLFDGQRRKLDRRKEEIKVLQPDGGSVSRTATVEASIHGPIVARRNDGRALALKVAGLDGASIVSQYWRMIRARNINDFNRASAMLQMPFFNVIYADRSGNIMYLFGGKQPARAGGDFEDYLRIQDGSTSKTLWTETLPWEALPKSINPPGGFVQNSNDPPWHSTFPQTIDPAAYPAWISPRRMEFRAQHGAAFLMSKDKFTFDEIAAGRDSVRLTLAERILPDLIDAARASGDPELKEAARVLAAWDMTAEPNSKGGALFSRWRERYVSTPRSPRSKVFGYDFPAFRKEWSPSRPLTTPVGLADPQAALAALARAVRDIKKRRRTLDVTWGETHRMILVSHNRSFTQAEVVANEPQRGANDVYGPLRVIDSFPNSAYNIAYGGDSYIQLVEFDKKRGAQARALLVYGNSSRPGSKHIADQLPLFKTGTLRKVLRTRAEVLENAVETDRY
jgi:acyl-homoserine-lactone acylase